MKKLLNTLYLTTPESYISKEGLDVVISVNQKKIGQIPIHNIEQIVTFGYMGASPGLMKLCVENNVSLTFLSPSGRLIGHFCGPIKGNVLLRKQQYKMSENLELMLHISRLFIAGKIRNYRTILQRAIRDNEPDEDVVAVVNYLESRVRKVIHAEDLECLRGFEGDAANAYFSVFPRLILQQKKDFLFVGRNRHPPKDAVNAMLSFAYSLLANDVASALETVGLDPYVGFLHTLRPGRSSLALDMMEEFRAYLGDRFVLSLINKCQIHKTDFVIQGENSIMLTDKGRNLFLKEWRERKIKRITHPYIKEEIPVGLLPYVQSLLLARYIRGDISDYPVFLLK